jgi:hypothetical protein
MTRKLPETSSLNKAVGCVVVLPFPRRPRYPRENVAQLI